LPDIFSTVQKIIKESEPSFRPALDFTSEAKVYLETYNGMMEDWNGGILGLKNGIYLDFYL